MKKSILFAVSLLLVAACSRQQGKPVTASSPAAAEMVTTTTVLATIADHEKPRAAAAPAGHAAGQVPPGQPAAFQVIFSDTGRAVAYIVEKNGRVSVVHNGKAGKYYGAIGEITFSSDGRRVAYGALAGKKWCMVVDGKEGSNFDAVGTPLFSPDSKHVAYSAMQGERWFLVVDKTVNSGTMTSYSGREFNADATLIAYVETADDANRGRLVVSDLAFKAEAVIMEGVRSPWTTNNDKTRIAAVSREDGKVRVIEFSFGTPAAIKKGPLCDVVNKLGYGPDGVSLAYDAERAGEHVLIFNDREERIPKGTLVEPPAIRPDLKSVGAIIAATDPAAQHFSVDTAVNAVSMHRFYRDAGKGKVYEEASNLIYNREGSSYAYTARSGQNWYLVVNGKEGPAFDRTVSPIFSPDGTKLTYRARKDGLRFVVVADINGKTIKQHPSYEQVFQPVFTPDGRSVAYGVKDGNKLIWKVEGL